MHGRAARQGLARSPAGILRAPEEDLPTPPSILESPSGSRLPNRGPCASAGPQVALNKSMGIQVNSNTEVHKAKSMMAKWTKVLAMRTNLGQVSESWPSERVLAKCASLGQASESWPMADSAGPGRRGPPKRRSRPESGRVAQWSGLGRVTGGTKYGHFMARVRTPALACTRLTL